MGEAVDELALVDADGAPVVAGALVEAAPGVLALLVGDDGRVGRDAVRQGAEPVVGLADGGDGPRRLAIGTGATSSLLPSSSSSIADLLLVIEALG
jgi:hypothetical protein